MSTSSDPWDFLTFDRLIVKPPITTNSVKNFDPNIIRQDAESTHIVVHPRYQTLVERFLAHKRTHGSKYEKALYASPLEVTWQDLVARLIVKRPMVFMGAYDHTLLRDDTPDYRDQSRMNLEWNRNGTGAQDQNKYLTLEEYLSYDEIMLGSLLGASGPSHFINDGNRYNSGGQAKEGTFESRGIIVGLVGARFERRDRMDSMFCLPEKDNKPKMDPELRQIFQEFFGVPRNLETENFDSQTYKGRIRITADILLLEANGRGKAAGKKAYVYVVGLGLGVWERHPQQKVWYLEAFGAAIKALPADHQIGTVEFAYITGLDSLQSGLRNICERKNIDVIFSKRNPAAKLSEEKRNQLLMLSYAWDGNAFPGNEYWQGSLAGSGDPAAASMSTIGELHNPLVNEPFTKRIKVVGKDGYV